MKPILILIAASLFTNSLLGLDSSAVSRLLNELTVTDVSGYPPRVTGELVGYAVPDDLTYETIAPPIPKPPTWDTQFGDLLDSQEGVIPLLHSWRIPTRTSVSAPRGDENYNSVARDFDYNRFNGLQTLWWGSVDDIFYGQDVRDVYELQHPAALAFDFSGGEQFVMDFTSLPFVSWPSIVGDEAIWSGVSRGDIVFVPEAMPTYTVFGYLATPTGTTTRFRAYEMHGDVDTFRPPVDASFIVYRTSPGIGSVSGYFRTETPLAILEEYLAANGGGAVDNVLYSRESNTTANTANGSNSIVHHNVANTISTFINWYAMAFFLVELTDGSVQGWIVPSAGYNAWTSSSTGPVANSMTWGVPQQVDMAKFFNPPAVALTIE